MRDLGYRLGLGLLLGTLGGCTSVADFSRRPPVYGQYGSAAVRFTRGAPDNVRRDSLRPDATISKTAGTSPAWILRPRH